MQRPHLDKKVLCAILSGSYSHFEENQFATLCIALADEAVETHIHKRRINEEFKRDLIHDAFMKLFLRNSSGEFPRIGEYIKKTHPDLDNATEEELLRTLRIIIAGSVYQAMIDNLKRRDKRLSDILRSIDYTLKTTQLFYKTTRFNDKVLVPRAAARLHQRPVIPLEFLSQQLQQSACANDTVPQLLRKLHGILVEQDAYQRILSVVDTGLLFKEIRTQQHGEITGHALEPDAVRADLALRIQEAADRLYERMHDSYVGKHKWTDLEYKAAIQTARDVFLQTIEPGMDDEESFFELARRHLPELKKDDYLKNHKHKIEYLVSLMKSELKDLGKELRGS